jgi:hypothetical protein
MKPASINKKAQTLVELAVFGSLLLVVLAYFVNWGLSLNYQQELNMRAQRMAFAQAYYPPSPTTHGSAQVILAEDHHIPNPQTIVGRGNYTTVAGSGDATWGNSMYPDKNHVFSMAADVERINFDINGQKSDYSTGGVTSKVTGTFWVFLPELGIYVEKTLGDLRVWKANKDPATELQAKMWLNGIGTYTQTDTFLVQEVAWENGGIPMKVLAVYSSVSPAQEGDPVTRIDVLDPNLGGINTWMMSYDFVKNYALHKGQPGSIATWVQGLVPVNKVTENAQNSLLLEETRGMGGEWKSTTTVDATTNVEHTIKTQAWGDITVPYSSTVNKSWQWTTPK